VSDERKDFLAALAVLALLAAMIVYVRMGGEFGTICR
jgi:hypothetical protein